MSLSPETFTRMNLLAGTARSLDQAAFSSEDAQIWERDFQLISDHIYRLCDPVVGADLAAQKEFYTAALQVAKGYFNDKPFGGLKSATGQFGFRLLGPQDIKSSCSAITPA